MSQSNNRKSYLSTLTILLLVLLLVTTKITTSNDEIIVPSTNNPVKVDGIIHTREWSDANHIEYASYDGGLNDIYIKYDLTNELLCIGFIIDDSNYYKEDSFVLSFDLNNDGGDYPKRDDYNMEMFRDTYAPNSYVNLDIVLGRGTGLSWPDHDDYDYNMKTLPYPFGKITWSRNEVDRTNLNDTTIEQGNSWCGEFTVSLPKTASTESGSVQQGLNIGVLFGQSDYYDVNGKQQYTYVYWPSPPGDVNVPKTWIDMNIYINNTPPEPTPSPTPTPTPTTAPTPTPTPTPTLTPTPTPTATPIPTTTPSPSPSSTPTPTPEPQGGGVPIPIVYVILGLICSVLFLRSQIRNRKTKIFFI